MFHKLVVIALYGQRLQDDDLDYKATRETRVSQSVERGQLSTSVFVYGW